jgi:hypothetical protein
MSRRRYQIGDQLWREGRCYVVTVVQPCITPFRRKDQTTCVEGYTLGLRAAVPTDDPRSTG